MVGEWRRGENEEGAKYLQRVVVADFAAEWPESHAADSAPHFPRSFQLNGDALQKALCLQRDGGARGKRVAAERTPVAI